MAERIAAGGYPAALERSNPLRRAAWYRDFVEAQMQRDVRELARIASLEVLARLLALAAAETACLVNITDLAAPFQLSRPTIGDCVTLLERIFLLERVPPWRSNRLSLRRQASWQDVPTAFYHFRERDGAEVDIVLERGAQVTAGVEVKAAATVTGADVRGLRKLREAAGNRCAAGVVLYDGETSAAFGDRFFAVPIRAIWETA